MTFALVTLNPHTIVRVMGAVPERLDLPSGQKVYGVATGWRSADGVYALVAVTPFVPPVGQTISGLPQYTFNGQGNVVETYATMPIPLNIIPFAVFISRWQDAEYATLLQKRAAAVTAGNVALIRQWDTASAQNSVDLNSPAAQNFKAALVTAAILTQARADVIFT